MIRIIAIKKLNIIIDDINKLLFLTGQAGINERENMKTEIANLDRIRTRGRGEEKSHVGMKKQMISNVDARKVIRRIVMVE